MNRQLAFCPGGPIQLARCRVSLATADGEEPQLCANFSHLKPKNDYSCDPTFRLGCRGGAPKRGVLPRLDLSRHRTREALMVLEVAHVSERSDRFMASHAGHFGAPGAECSLRRLAIMTDTAAKVPDPSPKPHSEPPSLEQELLYRVARGDRAALAQLYALHAGLMLGLAMRILRDGKEAEDLLHDVFVETWKRAGEYDPSRASVKGWLLMLVRSRCLDQLRSARVRRVTLVDSVPDDQVTAIDKRVGERGQLYGALDQLGADQRHVLELGYFQGLSSQEIADTLGVPIGTVKSRVAAALSNLRALIGPSAEMSDAHE